MTLKRFKVDKLLRDRIPSLLRSKGIVVNERMMDDEEYLFRLKEKLTEETEEVKNTRNTEELAEELADVLEVVHSLASASGLTQEDIEKARKKKREEKGGFENRVYSPHIEVAEESPSFAYYAAKEQHYPFLDQVPHQAGCIFCEMALKKRKGEIIAEFKHCFVLKDQYPVSNGHLLIIPNEHTPNWFTARAEVREDIMKALHLMKKRLDEELKPDGYNIGANCGEMAGQTVMHLHLHLIPRYQGDMQDPKGGVRGVIPEKQKY